jgi:hypothetical protein
VTLLHNPSWRPKPDQCKISPLHEYERETEYSLGRRNEDDGSERFEGPDHGSSVLDDDFVDEEKAKTFNKTEKIFSPVPRGWESNESMVPEADPGLLCGRVFAFVLRTRTFGRLCASPRPESLLMTMIQHRCGCGFSSPSSPRLTA